MILPHFKQPIQDDDSKGILIPPRRTNETQGEEMSLLKLSSSIQSITQKHTPIHSLRSYAAAVLLCTITCLCEREPLCIPPQHPQPMGQIGRRRACLSAHIRIRKGWPALRRRERNHIIVKIYLIGEHNIWLSSLLCVGRFARRDWMPYRR